MSQLDIQSNATCAFLQGVGNTFISNYPLLRILGKHKRIKYYPYQVDGIKNTLAMGNTPVVATDSDGTNMVTHSAGLNYSIGYHSHYPVKKVINPELMHSEQSKFTNVNAIQAVLDVTVQEVFNSLHSDLLNNTTNPLGTQGLLLAASDTPDITAYQGLDPAKYAFWKNQFYDGKSPIANSAFDGKGATPDNILKRLSYMINRSTIGPTSFASYALCGEGIYQLIMDALGNNPSLSLQSGKGVVVNTQEPMYNGVQIVNAGGLTRSGYTKFPSMTMVIFAANNLTLYYDNPFKRGAGFQNLVRLANNLNTDDIVIKTPDDVQSLVYIDVNLGSDKATFFKNPDSFSQWTHMKATVGLMVHDRAQLIRYSEA